MDKLDKIYEEQANLNKRVGFPFEEFQTCREHVIKAGELSFVNMDSMLKGMGRWLNNYIIAAESELNELRDCTAWKHWCTEAKRGERYKLLDYQNACVEAIDLLFFALSILQCLGLSPEDIYNLYMQKLAVNHTRQDGDYSMGNKTEDDNKSIGIV